MSDLPDLGPLYERHDESNRRWREHGDLTSDPGISFELIAAERAHYDAQEPVAYDADNRPKPGTIVLDQDGDGWVFGRSRWTQVSGNPNKYLRVPGLNLWQQYGPYREVGQERTGGRPTEWRYRTVRPRKR